MFRIRQIHNAITLQDQMALSKILHIYQEAFSYNSLYAAKIAKLLKFSSQLDFDIVLLAAEGSKNRVLGFTLSFYFPKIKYAYLDYLASDPKRSMRGYGSALYEATREWLAQMGCKGLFMDVPPDEVGKLKESSRIQINKKRMAFYERFGAFPIINTKYDRIIHKANQGYFTSLVYDPLTPSPLRASELKGVITKILSVKGNMKGSDAKVQEILSSIKDDPVKFRPPRYPDQKLISQKKFKKKKLLYLVTTGDLHQIHHLKEKGYVERPARVQFILRGLKDFDMQQIPIKHFGEHFITEVHSNALFKFLKKAEHELMAGQLLYPNVFPIRQHERIPKNWEMQAGYYCIDTFTPVTSNVFKASRTAVDAALTGAKALLNEKKHCYVLCRPPGHHAETKVFGGFCYFNNAAIAANFLSKRGRVFFLDIDYHHGNGSQDIFYSRNDVFYASIHGHPRTSYPYFSGYSNEKGERKGKGCNRNFPLFPGIEDAAYLKTLKEALLLCKKFNPDFLVLSLGMDIMSGDPTGSFFITLKGVKEIGSLIAALNLPTLIVQEGGYLLRNLKEGTSAFFEGFLH